MGIGLMKVDRRRPGNVQADLKQPAVLVERFDGNARRAAVDEIIGDVEHPMAFARKRTGDVLRALIAKVPIDHRPDEHIGQGVILWCKGDRRQRVLLGHQTDGADAAVCRWTRLGNATAVTR